MSAETNYLITYAIYRIENYCKWLLTISILITLIQTNTKLSFLLVSASLNFWLHIFTRLWRNTHRNPPLKNHIIERSNSLAQKWYQLHHVIDSNPAQNNYDLKHAYQNWQKQKDRIKRQTHFIKTIFHPEYQVSHLRIPNHFIKNLWENIQYYQRQYRLTIKNVKG